MIESRGNMLVATRVFGHVCWMTKSGGNMVEVSRLLMSVYKQFGALVERFEGSVG